MELGMLFVRNQKLNLSGYKSTNKTEIFAHVIEMKWLSCFYRLWASWLRYHTRNLEPNVVIALHWDVSYLNILFLAMF